MKSFLLYGIWVILLTACQKPTTLSLTHINKGKSIAIQPIGHFDDEKLKQLSGFITSIFRVPVTTLKSIEIPQSILANNKGELSADAFLTFLNKSKADSITIIIGITRSPIFTETNYDSGQRGKHTANTGEKHIFGLSYVNGNACIVSSNNLEVGGDAFFNDRLRKVIIHEMGHILGLPDCSTSQCIMSEKNGDVLELDRAQFDYCKTCRDRLN